jgi:hypothetical protein
VRPQFQWETIYEPRGEPVAVNGGGWELRTS